MRMLISIFTIAFLSTLISCKTDLSEIANGNKLLSDTSKYFYAEVFSSKSISNCIHSTIKISDTTQIYDILGFHHGGSQGYPYLFIAIYLPDSLNVRGQKIKKRLRAITKEEKESLIPDCPNTFDPLPPFLAITEVYSVVS